MDWVLNNLGLVVSWIIALLSAVWAVAVKFAKMEQKDSHQEDRIQKLEVKYDENHNLHLSNETRLVKLEIEISNMKETMVSVDKRLEELQKFLMNREATGTCPCGMKIKN